MSSVYSSAAPSRNASHRSYRSVVSSREHRASDNTQPDVQDLAFMLEQYKQGADKTTLLNSQNLLLLDRNDDEDAIARFRFELGCLDQSAVQDAKPDPAFAVRTPSRVRTSATRDRQPIPPKASTCSERSLAARRGGRPSPIAVSGFRPGPREVQSASPPRNRYERLQSSPEADTYAKAHRRRITINEARGSTRNVLLLCSPSGAFKTQDLPWMPGLTSSASSTTLGLIPTPATPPSTSPHTEDQIRRELELWTLRDGVEPLVNQMYKGQPAPDLILDSDDEFDQSIKRLKTDDEALEMLNSPRPDERPKQSTLKRSKSMLSIFQKRPDLDKLLDLYLDEDQDAPPPKTRPSFSRKKRIPKRSVGKIVTDIPQLPSPASQFRTAPSGFI